MVANFIEKEVLASAILDSTIYCMETIQEHK